MSTLRTYGEACAAAHALEVVGERWALLVVRELLLGPKRFSDLLGGVPHASANVVSQRLRELEASGVIRRRRLGPPASARVYELTEWGAELEELLILLGRWGSRSPFRTFDGDIGIDSLMLAVRSHFDSAAASGLTATYELRVSNDLFRLVVNQGILDLARGAAPHPDATISTDVNGLLALLTKAQDLQAAVDTGRVTFTGNADAVRSLLDAL
jgi:DNA-binding HxlR family transcriptional regulator/putative sterol carrier protein